MYLGCLLPLPTVREWPFGQGIWGWVDGGRGVGEREGDAEDGGGSARVEERGERGSRCCG